MSLGASGGGLRLVRLGFSPTRLQHSAGHRGDGRAPRPPARRGAKLARPMGEDSISSGAAGVATGTTTNAVDSVTTFGSGEASDE